MSKETGGLAFPTTIHNYGDGMYSSEGMTLRDYFAAKAMQGDMNAGVTDNEMPAVAQRAYKMADAMLKAREQ